MSDVSVPPAPPVTVEVIEARDFRVTLGACLGTGLGRPGESVAGDVYRIAPGARPKALTLGPGAVPVGEHRLLSEDGETLTVVALDLVGDGAAILPLAPIAPGLGYTLLSSRAPEAGPALPDRVAAALARGTSVVLGDGRPCPVETLEPGDAVLTRDHGPRPLRALLHARVRAAGGFAPVVFAPGTIGNAGDLVLSPAQRLHLFRVGGGPDGGDLDCLVEARRLVDGDRIRLREGGFVDYYGLVFDRHEVIYAEGFPCESLCLTPALAARLPAAMRAALARLGGLPPVRPGPRPESAAADLTPFRGG